MSKLHKYCNQKGASLVEILASIVILSLILIFFINILVLSGRTGQTSEEIIDATYLAQTEMENIYSLSKTTDYADKEAVTSLGYEYEDEFTDDVNITWDRYRKETGGRIVNVRITPDPEHQSQDMYRVIVEVLESAGDEPSDHLAKMENRLIWKEEQP